jgi:hypothetical protein
MDYKDLIFSEELQEKITGYIKRVIYTEYRPFTYSLSKIRLDVLIKRVIPLYLSMHDIWFMPDNHPLFCGLLYNKLRREKVILHEHGKFVVYSEDGNFEVLVTEIKNYYVEWFKKHGTK